MSKSYFVYIITNEGNSVLYTGVTNDLQCRVWEHKHGITKGFAKRYNANRLVYYEAFDNIDEAIAREKQTKKGPRKRKVALIEGSNPGWLDLSEELFGFE